MSRRLRGNAGVAALVAALVVVPACGKGGASGESAGLGPRWDDGWRYAYQVKMVSRTEMGSGNVLIDLHLTGGLALYARRADDGSVQLAARLADLQLEGESSGGDAKLADLARDLQRPWLVELRGGLVEAIRLPQGVPAAVAGIQRTLAAALQFAPPPSASARAWSATEHDATGRYAATYRALPEAGRFSKQKVRYESLLLGVSDVRPGVKLAPGMQGEPPEVTSSSAKIEVSDGRLRSSRSEDQIRAQVTPTTPVSSKTSLTLALTAADRATPPPELAAVGADFIRLRAGDPYAPPAPPLKLDAAKTAGWTFERAVAEIDELERTREPPKPQPPGGAPEVQTPAENARAQRMAAAFMALSAIFRQEPDKIPRAAALIRKDGAVAHALMDALGSSATGASQTALLELAKDRRLPGPLRQGAAGSLIRSEHPSEQAVTGLTGLLDDPLIEEYATYGLGTFARKLRVAGETDRSKRISELLIQRLASVREQQQKTTVLRGIANSAYAGALEPVRPYLSSEDPFLRAAAVQALRLMELPEVDRLIADRMKNDGAPVVRYAALSAALPRPVSPTLIAAVGEAATKAPDAQGRLQAVRLLVRWLPERTAEVQPALERAAHSDAEPKVRQEARRALDKLPRRL